MRDGPAMTSKLKQSWWFVALLLAAILHGAPAAAGAPGSGGADVRDSDNMRWAPGDKSVWQQNPPDFTWPWLPTVRGWQVELKGADGSWKGVAGLHNSLSWPVMLAPGDYEWRVQPLGGGPHLPSRHFTLPPSARPFLVPAPAEQLRYAASQAHPRYRVRGSIEHPETASFVDEVVANLRRSMAEMSYDQGGADDDLVTTKRAKREAKQAGQRAASQLAEVALAAQLGKGSRLAAEGRRRLLEAASWEPHGATGIDGVHAVARDIVWGMALLYDTLYAELSAAERKLVRDRIIDRVEDIKARFIDGARMQRKPYDSHGWVAWGGAAAAVALVVGDDGRADALFLELVPPFITSISPWGGPEGGFANGPAYGLWVVASLVTPFDVISQAIGVDLYTKSWLANVPRFFTYFLPPGAPEAPFGDAAELVPDRVSAWTMRALAQRTRDPLVKWAAGQYDPQHRGPMPLILASMGEPLKRVVLPDGTPNSAVFEDVGWMAMHSELADPRRTSVYFKSSPYGSHNHSHGDQNAFVLHAGGRALLKSSGYYDFYDSKHMQEWYAATRAHNAITFDGGKGQPVHTAAANGRIVFKQAMPDYDVVIGDAKPAYMGQLTKALRTLIYLRPGLLLVRDRLASESPRRWEWNLHADQRMEGDERSLRVESGGQTLCVDFLLAPMSRFEQSNQFVAPPLPMGKKVRYAEQWHAAFVSHERLEEAEYIVALRVGCAGTVPRLERDGNGWTLSVSAAGRARSVRLYDDEVVVK